MLLKSSLAWTTLILSLILVACSPPEVNLTGDVSIVTKGGQSMKLGSVEINLLAEATMQSYSRTKFIAEKVSVESLKQKKTMIEKELEGLNAAKEIRHKLYLENIGSSANEQAYREAQKRCDEKNKEYLNTVNLIPSYSTGAYYVEGLPTPLVTATTDADGKFTLRTQPGRYALVAHSMLKVGDHIEVYYWIVWVRVVRDHPTTVALTNDNLFETDCAECIIRSNGLAF
jgi:hypothetical protein